MGSSPSSRGSIATLSRAPLEAQRLEPPLDGPGEVLGDLAPGGREPGGGLLQGLPGFGQGRIEGEQVGVVPVERGELGLGRVAAVDQLVGRAAEPRGQSPVKGQSGLDVLEPRRGHRPDSDPGRGGLKATSRVSSASRSRAVAASASSGTARASGLESPRDSLEEPLRRAIRLVEQQRSPRRRPCGAARREPAAAPRAPARRTRRLRGSAAASSSRSNSSKARSRRRASAELDQLLPLAPQCFVGLARLTDTPPADRSSPP